MNNKACYDHTLCFGRKPPSSSGALIPVIFCKDLRVMSEKPPSATSDLQARTFTPARRRVVLADLTGRDGLFGE
jgi:hypothetical protein